MIYFGITIASILLIILAFVLGYYLGFNKKQGYLEKETTDIFLQYQQVQNYIHQNGII